MSDTTIEHRHTFYLDADDQLHSFPTQHFDRLWRCEPGAAMPELANQRVRFAVFDIERFTWPPRVSFECLPVLMFDTRGLIDVEEHMAQLRAAVELLGVEHELPELSDALANDRALVIAWDPDPAIRQRLTSALAFSRLYRSRAALGTRCSRASESHATYGRTRDLARC